MGATTKSTSHLLIITPTMVYAQTQQQITIQHVRTTDPTHNIPPPLATTDPTHNIPPPLAIQYPYLLQSQSSTSTQQPPQQPRQQPLPKPRPKHRRNSRHNSPPQQPPTTHTTCKTRTTHNSPPPAVQNLPQSLPGQSPPPSLQNVPQSLSGQSAPAELQNLPQCLLPSTSSNSPHNSPHHSPHDDNTRVTHEFHKRPHQQVDCGAHHQRAQCSSPSRARARAALLPHAPSHSHSSSNGRAGGYEHGADFVGNIKVAYTKVHFPNGTAGQRPNTKIYVHTLLFANVWRYIKKKTQTQSFSIMLPPMKAMNAKAPKSMTKTGIAAALATQFELKKKVCSTLLNSLAKVATKEVKTTGVFTLPGTCKIKTRTKPATKVGQREIFGKLVAVKAKPTRRIVKALPVAALKKSI